MKVALCSLAVLYLVFVGRVSQTEAVNCDITQLAPCMDAVLKGTPPTPECCEKAKEQFPCACQFMKDPLLGPYLKNPNTRKAMEACGLQWPSC